MATWDDLAAAEPDLAETGRRLLKRTGIGEGERIIGKDGPHALDAFLKVLQVNLVGT